VSAVGAAVPDWAGQKQITKKPERTEGDGFSAGCVVTVVFMLSICHYKIAGSCPLFRAFVVSRFGVLQFLQPGMDPARMPRFAQAQFQP
jgi:hypothetical protein